MNDAKKRIFGVLIALIGMLIVGLGGRKFYIEKKGGDF